jgi:hypothetical protein
MKVLDLFAGLKGWSGPAEERGHECFSVELLPKFPGISLYKDILSLSLIFRGLPTSSSLHRLALLFR